MVLRASVLIRLGGLAAAAGGVLWSLLWLIEVAPEAFFIRGLGGTLGNTAAVDNVVYVLLLLGVMAGVAALYALQRERYGLLGTLASLAAFVGAALLAVQMALAYGITEGLGDPYLMFLSLLFSSGLLLTTVGLLILGFVTMTIGTLPWWCGVAIMVGSPLFVLLGTVFLGILGPVVMLPVGVAWIFVGYVIFRAGSRPPERSARVR